MLHKFFNDITPEILLSETSDFLKQNFFSSHFIPCLNPFSMYMHFLDNLAQYKKKTDERSVRLRW